MRGARLANRMMAVVMPEQSTNEPEVIRRLPPGVEYTFVKMIIQGAPSPLTMLSWVSTVGDDPLWAAFRTKTYRVIDRYLRKEEVALSPTSSDEQRQRVRALRHHFVEQFFGDL